MRLDSGTCSINICREQLARIAVYRDIELWWEWGPSGMGMWECVLCQYGIGGMWRDRKTYCSHLFQTESGWCVVLVTEQSKL